MFCKEKEKKLKPYIYQTRHVLMHIYVHMYISHALSSKVTSMFHSETSHGFLFTSFSCNRTNLHTLAESTYVRR